MQLVKTDIVIKQLLMVVTTQLWHGMSWYTEKGQQVQGQYLLEHQMRPKKG